MRVWISNLPLLFLTIALEIVRTEPSWTEGLTSPRLLAVLPFLLVIGFVPLSIWLGLLALFRKPLARHAKLGRILVMAPCTGLLLFTVVRTIANPPSPETYFELFFDAEFPASASDIKIHASRIPDPGTVGFSFICDPAETEKMIQQMNLEEYDADPRVYSNMYVDYFRSLPDPSDWKDPRDFAVILDSGTGVMLRTADSMSRVYLIRDPLRAKPIDER